MEKEILRYEKDKSKKLNVLFEDVRVKYFPNLDQAKFNYVFRTTFKKDDEGRLVIGEAQKLSTRERDLYGYDFQICVHKKTWLSAEKTEKIRIAWHELNHCMVIYDGRTQPKRDRAGRINISMRPHDIVLKTFQEELKIFGPTSEQSKMISSLKVVSNRRRIKRRR
jgi:hypothetical protein